MAGNTFLDSEFKRAAYTVSRTDAYILAVTILLTGYLFAFT